MSAQPFHMKSARKLVSIEECVVDRPLDGFNSWRFLLNEELFVYFTEDRPDPIQMQLMIL